MNQEKEFPRTPKELKKEIYRRMAVGIFGTLAGRLQSGEVMAKTMYFANDEKGNFFLFAKKNTELESLDLQVPVVFCLFKEEETASEFAEIKVFGEVCSLEFASGEFEEGMGLFEEKSPYIGNLPWLDHPGSYQMFSLKPSKISFQQTRDERQGKNPVILIRESEAV